MINQLYIITWRCLARSFEARGFGQLTFIFDSRRSSYTIHHLNPSGSSVRKIFQFTEAPVALIFVQEWLDRGHEPRPAVDRPDP